MVIAEEIEKTDQQEILVVDDDPASLHLLTNILADHGYRVRPASGGLLALRSVAAKAPDLILLDVKMPDMDGFEVCRRLKADEQSRKIPVLFISALSETAEKVKGFEAGGVDYITKPFEPEEVLARVGLHARLNELTGRLEQKVRERTGELTAANRNLRREIAEREQAEALLRKTNRAYRALSECNKTLLRATDEQELLRETCRIIVKDCGYHLVWIGFAEHDEARTVRPVAQSGYEEGYLDTIRVTWADTEPGRGPTGTAVRTKKPVINRNIPTNPDFAPWRAEAVKRGYASSASLPLLTSEREIIGALNVYATQPDAFAPEEIYLLAELAGDLTYGIMSMRMRAERDRAAEAVKESRERFRNLVETTSDWVWETNENGVYTYVSPQVRNILGYEPEEVLGKTPFELMPPDEAKRVSGIFGEISASPKPFSLLENTNLRKDGSPVVLETSGVPLFDAEGNFRGYRGINRDITERKHAEETIMYQTYHDLLTGLPNRTRFSDLLNHEMLHMQHIGKRLAVLFLDVDQFRNVNDLLGHAAGDILIQDLAARLKGCIREFDIIARIGGDEFTILLPLINQPNDAARVAENILEAFKNPFIIDNHELHLTASIGVSLYPDDGDSVESLIKNSDIALHYAKDQGRNNYQFFNTALNIRTLERIIFENRLRQAVERGEFVVYYQPQQNIKTRELTGVEALVRWNHPELGLLTPMQFIPLAEEIGLIIQIDQWVLRAACKQLKAWEAAGHAPLFVTTNLSARQFQQPGLVKIVSEVLKETGLRPECLGIEITETLAMQDTELTSRNLEKLNAMGVKLLIDDFGTGYSSLSYLKKLPFHKLKIDRSFVTYLARDRDYQAIIDAIIAMAHILKLEVVAEGVETEDQVSFLNSRDCDEIQGYFAGKPVPAGEFEKMLVSAANKGGLTMSVRNNV